MSEAVRTMASPAAIWAIVVTATVLAFFFATVAMFMDLRVAREQRTERKLGIAPAAGSPIAMAAGSQWPRLGQALLAAAGVPPSEAAGIRTGVPAGDTATGDTATGGPSGEVPTRPDLMAPEPPGRPAAPMPRQRTGESDRAERSFAGPAPQEDDEDEQ